MNYPTSDLQHVAQMVLKIRQGDQITVKEAHRLEQIAEKGYSTVGPEELGPPTMTGQLSAEDLANATRAGGQI